MIFMVSCRNFPKVSACTVVNPRTRPACGAGAVLAKDQSFVSRLGNLLFNSQTTKTWVWLEKGASMDLQPTNGLVSVRVTHPEVEGSLTVNYTVVINRIPIMEQIYFRSSNFKAILNWGSNCEPSSSDAFSPDQCWLCITWKISDFYPTIFDYQIPLHPIKSS
jgi:hypothetical protein